VNLLNLLRSVSVLGIAVGLSSTGVAAPQSASVSCSTGVGCQFPDQVTGQLSDKNDANGWLWGYDNFKATASGTITSLCWWGYYVDFSAPGDCAPGTGDAFTVTYYSDGDCSGIPGPVRAGPFTVTLTNKFATGNLVGASGKAEYQYECAHLPVAVGAGECLWIRILNHTTQSCLWMWESSSSGDGRCAQGPFGPYPSAPDLAFCVNVATTDDGCNSALATSYCTAKVNSLGCTPSVSASLQTFSGPTPPHLLLHATQVLPTQSGLLFYSVNGAASSPFQGGVLCVTQPLKRTALQISSASGAPPCTGTYTFDFTALVGSGLDPALVAGQPVWAQYWSRDGGVPSGTGLTNALTFTICQ
jgi:hypothetical protein